MKIDQKRKLSMVVILGIILTFIPYATGEDVLLETYVARLSTQDHYSSDGSKFHTAAAIIRQDRANLHEFHKRDHQDESDVFFKMRPKEIFARNI